MTRFDGKRVLITGGTSGMGLSGARRIMAEGGNVILTGLNKERLEAAQAEFSHKAIVVSNDAAEPTASALAEVVKSAGKLDGLWLNAAFGTLGSPEDVDAGAFDRMMATNVRGPMLQLGALSPLLNSGASVVLTSSRASFTKCESLAV